MIDFVDIREDDFSIETEIERLKNNSNSSGAIVTFTGTVRDFSEGETVGSIDFDFYGEMAKKSLQKIRNEALNKFGIENMSVLHRVGVIEAGENIVLIVVMSKHREEAFNACKWTIDTLKKRVPVWKKELTGGGDRWVMPL